MAKIPASKVAHSFSIRQVISDSSSNVEHVRHRTRRHSLEFAVCCVDKQVFVDKTAAAGFDEDATLVSTSTSDRVLQKRSTVSGEGFGRRKVTNAPFETLATNGPLVTPPISSGPQLQAPAVGHRYASL